MKKQFFKANKTKLIARVMLLVLLVTGTISFTSCIDGGNGSYVNRRLEFDNINKTEEFISTHNSEEYLYAVLIIEENEVVEHKYSIDVIAKLQKKSDKYQMDTAKIEGIFDLAGDGATDSKIEVAFHSTNSQNKVYMDETSTFEIKAVNNDEMKQLFSSRYEAAKYTHKYNYAVLTNGVAVMHIVISCNQEISEDNLLIIGDMLLKSISIIK